MGFLSSSPVIRQLVPACLVGILASGALFASVYHLEQQSADDRFRELASQRIITIRTNIAIGDNSLALLVGHFAVASPDTISREKFRHLVTPTLSSHSFMQGFSWDPRVRLQDKARYEAMAVKDGLTDFRLTERDPTGKSKPVEDRPEYFPVYFMEPQSSNLRALGFDLASHPVRKQALDTARETGQPQATGRITLVQESGDQYGILVLAPVFGMETSADTQRRTLTGYVSGVFRIGDLITYTNGGSKDPALQKMVEIHLFDLSAPDNDRLLYPKGSPQTQQSLKSKLHVAEQVDVGGRQWLLIANPSSAYLSATRPVASYGVFAVSVLALVFFLGYLRSRIKQAESVTAFALDMAQARRRLAEAQRIAQICAIEYDRACNQLVAADEQFLTMMGLQDSPNPIINLHSFLERVVDEDVKIAASLFTASGSEAEFRLKDNPNHNNRIVHGRAEWSQQAPLERAIITLQDITARKQAEEERAVMIAHIAETDRLTSLGILAGGIAHEINTPTQYVGDNIRFMKSGLQSILNAAQQMREAEAFRHLDLDFLAQELPDAAEQALDGVQGIAKIVQAIKEFSFPSSTQPVPIDLNHLIEVVSVVTRNQWKYVAELDLGLHPDLPLVNGIEGELNQVLVNLLVNAAQAIAGQARSGLGRISIRTSVAEPKMLNGPQDDLKSEILLSVSDDGPGIAPENVRQIFDLFFTTKAPGQGTGQGLAIAKAIILRHGGQINVESSPGQGTCFTITLPAITR